MCPNRSASFLVIPAKFSRSPNRSRSGRRSSACRCAMTGLIGFGICWVAEFFEVLDFNRKALSIKGQYYRHSVSKNNFSCANFACPLVVISKYLLESFRVHYNKVKLVACPLIVPEHLYPFIHVSYSNGISSLIIGKSVRITKRTWGLLWKSELLNCLEVLWWLRTTR